MTRSPAEILAALEIPGAIAVSEGQLATGIGLGEMALVAELLGLESLEDVTNPGRLPLVKQLRLRQALMWVRVRRLRDSPDPELAALANTPFADTDAWLPVLPVTAAMPAGNGHGPPHPTTPAVARPRARSRARS